MPQRTLINLYRNEYVKGLHYYPFSVNHCNFNALNDTSNKMCVSKKTEDANLSVFNVIARISKTKTLTKYIHANVNANQIKYGIKIHVNASVKAIIRSKKITFRTMVHVVVGMVGVEKVFMR